MMPVSVRGQSGISIVLLASSLMAPSARADDSEEVKQAVAAIQKSGGRIERDEADAEKPVVGVNFATTKVDDAVLAPLPAFPKLKKVSLNGTKVTDAGMETLKGLPTLEKIYLVDTSVTDAGLEPLKGLKDLHVLSLVGTPVSDTGLEHLKGMKNLQEVFLAATKVTDDGVKSLKESLPKLKLDR